MVSSTFDFVLVFFPFQTDGDSRRGSSVNGRHGLDIWIFSCHQSEISFALCLSGGEGGGWIIVQFEKVKKVRDPIFPEFEKANSKLSSLYYH